MIRRNPLSATSSALRQGAREYLASGTVTLLAHVVAPVGGQELVTARILQGLVDRGHPVRVIAGRYELDPQVGVDVHLVRGPGRPASIRFPTFLLEAARLLQGNSRGLVQTTGAVVLSPVHVATMHFCHHAYHFDVGIRRASRDTIRHRLNERSFGGMAMAAERWCYRPYYTRRLVPVSLGLGREALSYFPAMAAHTQSIPNAVDVDRFRPSPRFRAELRAELGLADHTLLALFVGGDWQRKGLEFAIRALPAARGWHLAVVGDGPTKRALDWASDAGVTGRVSIVGPRTDTERWYAAADAFVFPTSYEAAPLVAYESMASGTPLLATRANGIEELLHDGSTGFFITRDPTEIATALRRLAAEPDTRARMSTNARTLALAHTWASVIDKYEALYDLVAHECVKS